MHIKVINEETKLYVNVIKAREEISKLRRE